MISFRYQVSITLTCEGTEVKVANVSGNPVLLRSRKGTNFDLCRVVLINLTECRRASPLSMVDTFFSAPPSSLSQSPIPAIFPLAERWWERTKSVFEEERDDTDPAEDWSWLCCRSLDQLAWVRRRMWIRELVTFTFSRFLATITSRRGGEIEKRKEKDTQKRSENVKI